MQIACRIAEILEGPNPPHLVRPRYQKTPVRPSVKLKNSMYLITCDFKFFNTILAKFSGDPWVMGHMGHGSSVQWVMWVMGQSE
jgi:hypothetical protein